MLRLELDLNKKKLWWPVLGLLLAGIALIQFIPAEPVLIPARLPENERASHRLLNFEGIANFRDLGGYRTAEGKSVRWGVLYRSGQLGDASQADLQVLGRLALQAIVDFRSDAEKTEAPGPFPDSANPALVDIPIMDAGDETVLVEIMRRVEEGDFSGFDPDAIMENANRQLANSFAPQFAKFLQVVLAAGGKPVLWHCSAGKDRTGYASALLLRLLGVPEEVILEDYMLSEGPSQAGRRQELMMLRVFKGKEAADKLAVLLSVKKSWLRAAFDEIDRRYGNFDAYRSEALGLSTDDIHRLQASLLE